ASQRFDAGSSERGLAAVQGAMALVRTREITSRALFGSKGVRALQAAAKEWSTRGDEGRAHAMYELIGQASGDQPVLQDAKDHLNALNSWATSQTGRPMINAAAIQHAAVSRRVMEPTESALSDSTDATIKWVQAALEIRAKYRVRGSDLSQEELYEGRRALEAGGLTLVCLYLRDADAVGALAAVDKAQARQLLREDTAKALERVTERADAAHWL